ncbi:MAG: shikimate kinase [Candidatus Omnitrophica bacterium]|nr:shikimate kinase [Candidatus Omnitrophota bacterium]
MILKNIVLIGFMGTGKTSVGKILASRLGRRVIDIDRFIETSEKKKIREIFEKEGEARFRVLEKEAVGVVARQTGVVITTGGGVVLDPENVRALRRNGVLVELTATPETVFRRVKDSARRPLLGGGDLMARIRELYEPRRALYGQSDYHFSTDGRSPSEAADEIFEKLKGPLALENGG